MAAITEGNPRPIASPQEEAPIAEYERRRNGVGSGRVRAPIVRFCVRGRWAGIVRRGLAVR
jgi:hypothetical protein